MLTRGEVRGARAAVNGKDGNWELPKRKFEDQVAVKSSAQERERVEFARCEERSVAAEDRSLSVRHPNGRNTAESQVFTSIDCLNL